MPSFICQIGDHHHHFLVYFVAQCSSLFFTRKVLLPFADGADLSLATDVFDLF